MTLRTLIRRSLRFHWRSHLGVVIGATIGSAALVGALVVGDSVKGSLREKALERLGNIDAALMPADRLFSEDLAERLVRIAPLDSGAAYAPALILPASVTSQDRSTRANSIQLIGVDGRFTAFGGERWNERIKPDTAHLNEALAKQLGVEEGQYVLVRARMPSDLSMEVPTAPRSAASLVLRLRVDSIVPDDSLGSLALEGAGLTPLNLFMRLEDLQRQAKAIGSANRILARAAPVDDLTAIPGPAADLLHDVGEDARVVYSRHTNTSGSFIRLGGSPDPNAASTHSRRLMKAWRFVDTQCEVTRAGEKHLEMRSDRIFLDPPIERAALATDTNARPVLTYIANLLTSGTHATPYSMVTAAGAPWTPAGLKEDEIVLNQWLADDLQARPGDQMTLVYYNPESGGQLVEHTNVFRVHSIVPMEMPWADRTLMPDFPGIEEAETTADWDTAFPLTHKIRPKDDEYWQQHRGTPKAFITLAAGKEMWANRFGEVTAIRFPVPTNFGSALTPTLSPVERENRLPVQREWESGLDRTGSPRAAETLRPSRLQAGESPREGERLDTTESFGTDDTLETHRNGLEQGILSNLDPAELGLRFEPVREQALEAAQGSQDFGGLFIGFSLFLIAAALILMALLFQFGLEERSAEVGTLLALGFTHKQVRRLLLGEGAALAFIGGVIGVAGGVFYAKAMLLGLTTVWKDAVGATTLKFFVTPGSLAIGLLASTLVAVFTIWLALRKQAKRPAIALLRLEVGSHACESVDGQATRIRRITRVLTNAATVGVASLVVAVSLVGWALAAGETTNAGMFFGAGTLVLIGALALMSARLQRSAGVAPGRQRNPQPGSSRDGRATFSAATLALRGLARRRFRSVATAALLACGSFLILSIGVFRLDANRDATERTSGTGGFALIGESTIPIVQDLNTTAGREFFAWDELEVEGAEFVQFRVRAGDDASCLNLNRAQQPRLMGVQPEALEGRFTFAKVASGLEAGEGWQLLESEIGNRKSEIEVVSAIGDLNSILWAMGKKVGDTIDYVDDRGRPFKVRIVGGVANSILQGTLIIDEATFVQRFPDKSGYRYFLMDAPPDRVDEVSGLVSRTLQDYGMEVTPAARRLNQFNAVQNTYLGTFQVLGGLGLLLGSAGLGVVVLRNVLERRGELAVLMAVGFRRNSVERMVLMEHAGLLGLGLAIGLVAAVVAVLPTLISPAAQLPYATLLPTLVAVLANGLIWTWVATRLAMRGNLLEALRNE